MRSTLQTVAIATLLLVLYGCTQTTTGIWNRSTYGENISQFMVSTKDSSLIIIADKYHYIFSKNSAPLSVLSWSGRKLLKADFSSGFEIGAGNVVTGEYSILCSCESASIEQIQWLESNGFQLNKNGRYKITLKVNGTRYLAGNIEITNTQKLNNQYRVSIRMAHSTSGIIGRAALTPVAVALDGVATIGAAALLVISIPFSLVD